ncbi:MAG: YfiR family protein [Planctomycetes bacterium]|nr:YfiR family protein [Planctomycetota bacterium]
MNRIALLAALVAGPGIWTGDQAAREYEVKAAFLYNFAAYVEWPKAAFAEESSPILVCVVGADPFAGTLDRALQGKTAQGRSLAVRHAASAKEAKGCHIVFLPAAEGEQLAALTAALAGTPALLVGESEGLARKGAACNFAIEDSRVRLEVNVGTAEKAGLRLGSKLLKIARRVDE